MNEPEWLDKEMVLESHQEVINMSGGSHGVRELLESALSRPQNVFTCEGSGIFDLAASYAEAIAHNHPFIDGNKRTALMAADNFLKLNGYELATDPGLADMMVDLAEKKIGREEVATFLRQHSGTVAGEVED